MFNNLSDSFKCKKEPDRSHGYEIESGFPFTEEMSKLGEPLMEMMNRADKEAKKNLEGKVTALKPLDLCMLEADIKIALGTLEKLVFTHIKNTPEEYKKYTSGKFMGSSIDLKEKTVGWAKK